MNKQEQTEHFEEFTERMREVLLAKGDDYAGEENRLANFERAGAIAGVTPQINCLNLIATKVARLGVLMHSPNQPNNESIRDSILDLANYAVLLDAIESENQTSSEISFGAKDFIRAVSAIKNINIRK